MPAIGLVQAVPSYLTADYLTVGEESMPRGTMLTTSVTTTSGFLRLTCWTARKTETSTQGRMLCGTVAAGATPTLCKICVFELDASNNGTLVGVTANDTALFATITTAYTRSWVTPFQKVAGRRYGMGALIVTAAATPSFAGRIVANNNEAGVAPATGLVFTGLADVPSTLTGASAVFNGAQPYGVVLP